MKMKDRINKQATDMVDMALEWVKLSRHLEVSEEGKKSFLLFDAMQAEVLKTYTNIEDLKNDKAMDS